MATPSKVAIANQLRKIIKGIEANLAGSPSLPLAGSSYKPAALTRLFEAQLAAMDAVTTLEAQLKAAREASAKAARKTLPVQRALEEYLRAMHGGTSANLRDYGFVPDSPRKVTAETKAEAVVKARATRVARHTMGKRQRLKIKGSLTPS